jgi:hypothetical protein
MRSRVIALALIFEDDHEWRGQENLMKALH